MGKPDISALAQQMIEATRGAIARSEAAMVRRIEELDARLKAIPAGPRGEPGPAGESIKGDAGAAGKDGVDGKDGKDGTSVHQDTIALMVREAAEKIVATLPKPKDGADGFSLDDFDVSLAEDGRTLTLKFQRGDVVKERQIKLQTTNYRGVWREGEHDRGDVVTWGGSSWHCNQQTKEKPAYGCADWTLMVKEGRPGKDSSAPTPAIKELVRLR